MLRLEWVRTVRALEPLQAGWEALYAADRNAQLFVSWPFLRAYLPAMRYAWSVLALHDGGELVAVLPLSRTGFPAPHFSFDRELRLAAYPFADYSSMLCAAGRDDEAIESFAAAIARSGWENFNLADTSDPRMEPLARRVATLVGGAFALVSENRILKLPLDLSWEAYLARLDAKRRNSTMQAMKRTSEVPGYRETEASAADVEAHIDAVIRLKQQRFGGWLTRWQRNYHRIFRNAFDTGALRLFAFWAGDRPISAAAVFVDRRTGVFADYMRGHDPAYNTIGPGRAMVAFLIRRAIEDGYGTFDFLRGDERYKRDFTDVATMNRSYRVTRPGPRAALVNAARPAFFKLKVRVADLVYRGGRSES